MISCSNRIWNLFINSKIWIDLYITITTIIINIIIDSSRWIDVILLLYENSLNSLIFLPFRHKIIYFYSIVRYFNLVSRYVCKGELYDVELKIDINSTLYPLEVREKIRVDLASNIYSNEKIDTSKWSDVSKYT